MDSFYEAVKYVFIYIPLLVVLKFVEVVGFCYGLMKQPFQEGSYKSNKMYDRIKNGKP